MNTDTKNKVQDALREGVKHSSSAAKTASGWKKAVYITLAILAWLASLYLASCGQLTPEQMQQIRRQGELVHEAYHALTGKPCKFERGTLIYMPAPDDDEPEVEEEGK